MEKQKVFITEDSYYFKKGQVIKGSLDETKGLTVGKHFLNKNSFIVLKEKLDKKDEDRIKQIVREIFKLYLWRNYTRSNLLLK